MSEDHRNGGTLILAKPLEVAPKPERGEACLVLLHPPGPELGRRMALVKPSYMVGRENDVDLVIPRSSVSRNHSRITLDEEGGWWVQDLGSTNGTFVNEERIVSRLMADGDQVRFGDVIYKFLTGSNIESAYHEEIYRMTILDGLTGIHNKRFFLEFIERELAGAARHGHALTLVMFDVDHFKKVNDTRGHLAGDEVLKDLCARIKPRVRREDLFARYGGEEFACVLPSTQLAGGVVFAEHLRSLIAERPTQFEDTPISFTISCGVATVHNEGKVDGDSLIKRADENLYVAKRNGRNQVVPSLSDLVG